MTLATRDLLLREAEELVRTVGYAGFSYADLSERVGIRKASIHHHFPTKEALGAALIDGYLEDFERQLAGILATEDSFAGRLELYSNAFVDSLDKNMMPLCAALSAETAALPESLQARVRRFFHIHLDWLKRVLKDGVESGELAHGLDIERSATLILATLEGASLVAWALKDASLIRPAIRQAIATLKASPA